MSEVTLLLQIFICLLVLNFRNLCLCALQPIRTQRNSSRCFSRGWLMLKMRLSPQWCPTLVMRWVDLRGINQLIKRLKLQVCHPYHLLLFIRFLFWFIFSTDLAFLYFLDLMGTMILTVVWFWFKGTWLDFVLTALFIYDIFFPGHAHSHLTDDIKNELNTAANETNKVTLVFHIMIYLNIFKQVNLDISFQLVVLSIHVFLYSIRENIGKNLNLRIWWFWASCQFAFQAYLALRRLIRGYRSPASASAAAFFITYL